MLNREVDNGICNLNEGVREGGMYLKFSPLLEVMLFGLYPR